MKARRTAIVPKVIFSTAAITSVIPACGGNTESDRGKAGAAGKAGQSGQGGNVGTGGNGGTGAFYVLAIGGFGNQPVDAGIARGGSAGTGGFLPLGAYGFGGSGATAAGGAGGDMGGAAGELPDAGPPNAGGYIVLAIEAFRGSRDPGS